MTEERELCFDDVFERIPGGDILLWRAGCQPISWLIARGSRSIYSHVAMTAWHTPRTGRYYTRPLPARRLVMLDTLQWVGGRSIEVEDTVERYPGRWDWFHVQGHLVYDRRVAIGKAIEIIGKQYGWLALWYAAIRNAAITRFLLPPDRDDDANGMLLHCAAAASLAMKAGGLDPVLNLANRSTMPGDFERSTALEYQGTLFRSL